jgi:hypothetical protein
MQNAIMLIDGCGTAGLSLASVAISATIAQRFLKKLNGRKSPI